MAAAEQTHLEPGAVIRIVLADDHPVVRRGLRMLLDDEADFEVVAEAGTVEEARRYVLGHHPTVLVLDLNMPGGPSLGAIPGLRVDFPQTQIVVLTMQQEPAYAREALAAGATATSSSRRPTASSSRRCGSRRSARATSTRGSAPGSRPSRRRARRLTARRGRWTSCA
ncbi:MAG TPA: response regulator transcription factor [Solirubrobacteraceae bacterium]|nr:response regulator transcription factor [Solirubrobacteraceae bacterium]